jgi:hypothetical protein
MMDEFESHLPNAVTLNSKHHHRPHSGSASVTQPMKHSEYSLESFLKSSESYPKE